MEPDWSCGPFHPTMPVPIGLNGVSYWRTFILEVGFAQSQNLLTEKAERWAEVPGVKYILCLRINMSCKSFWFKLYYVSNGVSEIAAADAFPLTTSEWIPKNC